MTSVVARPTINVLDPEFYVDPWDAYRWLRDEEPCFWDPVQQMWALSRYEDIRAVEKDDEHFSSWEGSRPQTDQRDDGSMINLNDPEHQQQRSLVFRRFTPRAIRSHEEHVRDVVTEILDKVIDLGECEAIDAIASPLPAIMIGDLLGYPRELWERVRFWSEQTMHLSGQTSPDGPPHVQDPSIGAVVQEYAEITLDIINQRRENPQDDLISIWTHAQGWDPKRVLEETLLLLDGGAETTRTVIGSMIRELALQPDQRDLLLERPELLEGHRGRGIHPLGLAAVQHATHGCGRPGTTRAEDFRGRAGPVAVRFGQPRPSGIRQPRCAGPDPGTQPAYRFRFRHPRLPGCAPCPARNPGDVRGIAAPHAALGARRSGRAQDPAGHVCACVRPHPHSVELTCRIRIPTCIKAYSCPTCWSPHCVATPSGRSCTSVTRYSPPPNSATRSADTHRRTRIRAWCRAAAWPCCRSTGPKCCTPRART